jgi:hypothetical protein
MTCDRMTNDNEGFNGRKKQLWKEAIPDWETTL